MDGSELLVTLAVGAAIAVGVVGTVLPLLPGIPLVWGAMVAYGILLGFGWQGWVAMVLATALGVLGVTLGVLLPQRSAAASGMTLRGQAFGLAAAVIGFFVVPVVGAPLGFVAGVWLNRWWSSRDAGTAWRSTRATVGAIVRASAAQLACSIGMGVIWAAWVVLR